MGELVTIPVVCTKRGIKGLTVDKVYLASKYMSIGDLFITDPDNGEARWFKDEFFAYDRKKRDEIKYCKYGRM